MRWGEFLVTDFYGCIDVQGNEMGGKYDKKGKSLYQISAATKGKGRQTEVREISPTFWCW
jgi:hypothetical protein